MKYNFNICIIIKSHDYGIYIWYIYIYIYLKNNISLHDSYDYNTKFSVR